MIKTAIPISSAIHKLSNPQRQEKVQNLKNDEINRDIKLKEKAKIKYYDENIKKLLKKIRTEN